jgi:hypothetical protein
LHTSTSLELRTRVRSASAQVSQTRHTYTNTRLPFIPYQYPLPIPTYPLLSAVGRCSRCCCRSSWPTHPHPRPPPVPDQHSSAHQRPWAAPIRYRESQLNQLACSACQYLPFPHLCYNAQSLCTSGLASSVSLNSSEYQPQGHYFYYYCHCCHYHSADRVPVISSIKTTVG